MVTTNDQGPFSGPAAGTDIHAGIDRPEPVPSDATAAVAPDTGHQAPAKGRGARGVVVPVVAAVVAGILAAGVTFAVLRAGAERARDQRDEAQIHLAAVTVDLDASKASLTSAEAVAAGCRQLADDSAAVIEQLAELDRIFNAYLLVEVGTPEEAALGQQSYETLNALNRLRGSISSSQAICGQVPVGT